MQLFVLHKKQIPKEDPKNVVVANPSKSLDGGQAESAITSWKPMQTDPISHPFQLNKRKYTWISHTGLREDR